MANKELFNRTVFGYGNNSYMDHPFSLENDDDDLESERLDFDVLSAWLLFRGFEDYRRGWELILITYKDKPVSIYQRAGRELDDYVYEYCIDKRQREKMAKAFYTAIRTLKPTWSCYDSNEEWLSFTMYNNFIEYVTDLNAKNISYTNFYGAKYIGNGVHHN